MDEAVDLARATACERELPGLQRAVPLGAALRLPRRRPGGVPGHGRHAPGTSCTPCARRASWACRSRCSASPPTCSSATAACRGLVVLARNAARALEGERLMAEAGARAARPGQRTWRGAGPRRPRVRRQHPGLGRRRRGRQRRRLRPRRERRPGAGPLPGRRHRARQAARGAGVRLPHAASSSATPSSWSSSATFRLPWASAPALLQEIAQRRGAAAQQAPARVRLLRQLLQEPLARAARGHSSSSEAGLKGLRVGNAMVSAKHANFLVALPGARAPTTSWRCRRRGDGGACTSTAATSS